MARNLFQYIVREDFGKKCTFQVMRETQKAQHSKIVSHGEAAIREKVQREQGNWEKPAWLWQSE